MHINQLTSIIEPLVALGAEVQRGVTKMASLPAEGCLGCRKAFPNILLDNRYATASIVLTAVLTVRSQL